MRIAGSTDAPVQGGVGGVVVFSVVSPGLGAFAVVNRVAGESIAAVGSADSAAMLEAAAVAIGPIGAGYLAAYGQAQASILAATSLWGVCTRRSVARRKPGICPLLPPTTCEVGW